MNGRENFPVHSGSQNDFPFKIRPPMAAYCNRLLHGKHCFPVHSRRVGILKNGGEKMAVYFGADYYPEHWPRERWATDAALMEEMGIDVVRHGRILLGEDGTPGGRIPF